MIGDDTIMNTANRYEDRIRELLEHARTIAVVGLSESPIKPSNQVSRYMQDAGYRIIPINPKYKSILGEKCYPDLHAVPDKIDIVNIFRNPAYVLPIVEQALAVHPQAIWMQLGVVNEAAAQLAEQHQIPVIMDRCIKIEHMQRF